MPASTLPPYPGLDVVSDRRVWSGRFQLDVITFKHRRFDGTSSAERTWELFRRGRAAALLPYDPWSDSVVLMEQFRLPALAGGVDPIMVEIPAGLCEPGEDPAATVRREIQEEMGLAADRLEPIGDYILTPGGSDERCTLFAGRVRATAVDPDASFGLAAESEDIRVRVWPADRAIDDAVAGLFPNSVTALALLWLAARRAKLRADWCAT